METKETLVKKKKSQGLQSYHANKTQPCSVMVNVSICESKGRRFKSHQYIWDFSAMTGSYPELGMLWTQWKLMLEPHSRTSSTSRMLF